MGRIHVRKNDVVEVIAGKDAGKRGRVLQVLPKKGRVMVEGVNKVKRHTKPNPQRNIKGGVLERENWLHVSNVLPIDPQSDRATRVGVRIEKDGTRVRIARRSGMALDK